MTGQTAGCRQRPPGRNGMASASASSTRLPVNRSAKMLISAALPDPHRRPASQARATSPPTFDGTKFE